MSFLLVCEIIIELLVVGLCVTLIGIIRFLASQEPLSKTSVKIKKYAGFIVLGLIAIILLNIGYTVYRFNNPVNPYELLYLRHNPFGDGCERVKNDK